jgi:hypothetical protein
MDKALHVTYRIWEVEVGFRAWIRPKALTRRQGGQAGQATCHCTGVIKHYNCLIACRLYVEGLRMRQYSP